MAADVDFARDIQPIFAQSCYSCHGPKSQLGGLRLDAKSTAMTGGQSGKAIVAGKASNSLLLQRISGSGEQARMPMGGKPLPAEKIALIRQWIDSGAEWPDTPSTESAEIKKHWAFIAPKKAPLPQVKNAAWAVNPIDRFRARQTRKRELSPSRRGDRATLLRRLSLDLIGLAAECGGAACVPERQEPERIREAGRSIAGLAALWRALGPHLAGRGALCRFGRIRERQASLVWFYRDWVIDALNRDLPYDQFVIEQIAGDLLPNATQSQIVATGFLRNSMINEEGGVDPEQFRMEAMYDRMDAIGKAILGVTIQCAQCHNHKYDPAEAGRVLPHVRVSERFARSECCGLHAGGADEARRDFPAHARTGSRSSTPLP